MHKSECSYSKITVCLSSYSLLKICCILKILMIVNFWADRLLEVGFSWKKKRSSDFWGRDPRILFDVKIIRFWDNFIMYCLFNLFDVWVFLSLSSCISFKANKTEKKTRRFDLAVFNFVAKSIFFLPPPPPPRVMFVFARFWASSLFLLLAFFHTFTGGTISPRVSRYLFFSSFFFILSCFFHFILCVCDDNVCARLALI